MTRKTFRVDKDGKLKTSENEVKKAVNNYLQLLENQGKLYFVRNNSFAGTLISKTGYKSYVRNGKAGSPDFIVLLAGGQWLGIECKASNGVMSPIQIKTREHINILGGEYLVIADIQQLIDYLKEKE